DKLDEWGLFQFKQVRWSLFIIWPADHSPFRDLRKIRQLLEDYRELSAQDFLERIGSSRVMEFGQYSIEEGQQIIERGKALGLNIRSTEKELISYSLYDTIAHREVMIKDNELNTALTQAMLSAGVPIVGEFDADYRTPHR